MAELGKVEGLDTILRNMNAQIAGIEDRTLAGLLEAGLFIEREAKALTPVDTGNLRNSGYTRQSGPLAVDVGFQAAYAIFVHENLEAKHTNGQAKFLERPIRENAADIVAIIERRARIGATV